MKQIILKWLNHTEERLKKLRKQLKKVQKENSPKKVHRTIDPFDDMLRVGKIDDGILKAEILHNKKEVIIRVQGFSNEFRAFDWAKLQSVLWQTDQDSRNLLDNTTKKRLH